MRTTLKNIEDCHSKQQRRSGVGYSLVNSAGSVPSGRLPTSCLAFAGCRSLRGRKKSLLQIVHRPTEILRRRLGAGQGLQEGALKPLLFNTFTAVPTVVLQRSNIEAVGQVHLGDGVPKEGRVGTEEAPDKAMRTVWRILYANEGVFV